MMMFPYCELFNQQVPQLLLNNCHYNSKVFRLGQEHCRRRETLQLCFEANRLVIRIKLKPLKVTTTFPYLGRTPKHNNSELADIYNNLSKTQRRYGMEAKVMGKRGAPIKYRYMMYEAVVYTVLLYGSEIWVVT